MKFKFLAIPLALLAAQTAFAANTVRPFSCPSVETIQNIGITNIINDDGGPPSNEWFGVETSNRYGTNVDWTFVIGGFEGQYRSDILAKANAAISTLSFKQGPIHSGRGDGDVEWICEYESSDSSARFAIAITPPFNFDAIALVKKRMKK